MIELYHCTDTRSFRALWALEELGVDYALRMLPFPPRVHAKEFLASNPLGTVPLLVDGGTTMTESSAIIHYLATRYGPSSLAVAVDEAGYGEYLNGLHYGEATLTFPQTIVLRYSRFEPPERRLAQAVADYGSWFGARLRLLEARLADHQFAAADRFTMADISIGYALKLAHLSGLAEFLPQPVAEYWARLEPRDGYRRAMTAQAREAEEQHGAASKDVGA